MKNILKRLAITLLIIAISLILGIIISVLIHLISILVQGIICVALICILGFFIFKLLEE